MEELGSREQIENSHRINQRILTRTNSVTQVPQFVRKSLPNPHFINYLF
jgi:hypothetical protein